jgi:hypothetical protein
MHLLPSQQSDDPLSQHPKALSTAPSSGSKRTRSRRKFQRSIALPYLNLFIGAVFLSAALVILFHMRSVVSRFTETESSPSLSQAHRSGVVFPWSAIHRHQLFPPSYPLVLSELEQLEHPEHFDLVTGPDPEAYGNLNIHDMFPVTESRQIYHDDYDRYEIYRHHLMETMNASHPMLREQYWHNDELIGEEFPDENKHNSANKNCRRNNWSHKFYSNCNQFHEMHMEVPWGRRNDTDRNQFQDYDFLLRAKGSFVHVWFMVRPSMEHEFLVFKRFKFSEEYPMNIVDISHSQQEAVILEQLSNNDRFINIHGYCGVSTLLEGATGDFTQEIMPSSGFISQEDLDVFQKDDVLPLNNLSLMEKLDSAIVMAEALADLHGFKGGAIAHGDVYPSQWLRTYDGKLKLNDFNAAVVPEYDPVNQQYCTFDRCYLNWNRAPEDLSCGKWPADVGIDTYCMGNNIYTLLTGLWSFYWAENQEQEVMQSVLYGNRTYIDPRYRTRSMVEGKLVELMEKTWIENTHDRISIFGIVQCLREIKALYEIEVADKKEDALK